MPPDEKYAQRLWLLHLEFCRQSRIVGPFIPWIFFCWLWSVPFYKIKISWWPTIAHEKIFRLMYSKTHLNSHETVPLSTNSKNIANIWKIRQNLIFTDKFLPTNFVVKRDSLTKLYLYSGKVWMSRPGAECKKIALNFCLLHK